MTDHIALFGNHCYIKSSTVFKNKLSRESFFCLLDQDPMAKLSIIDTILKPFRMQSY